MRAQCHTAQSPLWGCGTGQDHGNLQSKCSKLPPPPVNMPLGALLGGETKERMRASLSREPSEVKLRSPSCGNTLIKADDFFDRILCYACSGWLQTCGFSFS